MNKDEYRYLHIARWTLDIPYLLQEFPGDVYQLYEGFKKTDPRTGLLTPPDISSSVLPHLWETDSPTLDTTSLLLSAQGVAGSGGV